MAENNAFQRLEQKVAELEAKIKRLEEKGARDFQDTDTVIKRNLYAEKVYTKRSGSYVELTS